jgi:hypothetical protein
MIVYVLSVELWGTACVGDRWCGTGECQRRKYFAKCDISKKDLESAAKTGHIIKVEELSTENDGTAFHT